MKHSHHVNARHLLPLPTMANPWITSVVQIQMIHSYVSLVHLKQLISLSLFLESLNRLLTVPLGAFIE